MDFDTPIERRGTGSSKWEKYAGQDILPLWVADMDFASPQVVIDAIKARADHGVFGYNEPPPGVVDTVLGYLEGMYGWTLTPDDVLFSPGVVPVLNQLCRGLVRPGHAVVTTTPVYHPFLSAPEHFGRELVRVPWTQDGDGRWQFPMDALAATLASRQDIDLFLLCHPHNPLGRWLSPAELTQIVALCVEHDVLISSDEIHCDLLFDGRRHTPTATIPGARDITVTMMAASKTFNVAGLGGSVTVIRNPDLRARFAAAGAGIMANVTTFAYAALKAAWQDGEPWRQALLAYLEGNRAYLADRVAGMPAVSVNDVEATYLAWLDCRALAVPDLEQFFLAAGLGLSPGAQFDGAGFMRLNFACPRVTLAAACDRLEKALAAT